MTPDQVERFLNELTKPMYVWRMARAQTGFGTERQRASAEVRCVKALAEIADLIKTHNVEWAAHIEGCPYAETPWWDPSWPEPEVAP